RWWWMGHEYQVSADGTDVVMEAVQTPGQPQRFGREAPDRWRGRSGENEGEILTVLRTPDGQVDRLDIATFVFGRDPDHLA
ncbi:MAG: hypothetical protein QOH97_3325, partial [Actinoplanes sp.]|nr:hypothetical protein [Actinoplanes sp.]